MSDIWQSYINEFKAYLLLERGFSINSIEAYMSDINIFKDTLQTLNLKTTPASLSHEDINIFFAEKKLTARTQARYLSAIKSFLKYLVIVGLKDNMPAESFNLPAIKKKLPFALSLEEITNILDIIPTKNHHGFRNKMIIEMLYGCGLRVSELIATKYTDIDFYEKTLSVFGKGQKQRIIPISGSLTEKVKHLVWELRNEKLKNSLHKEYIFLGQGGKPLTRTMVFLICQKYARMANIKKEVSPHVFRHSYASHMIENGADLRIVQEMLGHENLSTTEVYTHLSKEHLRNVFEKFHPLKGL